jgi:hypothetical protein
MQSYHDVGLALTEWALGAKLHDLWTPDDRVDRGGWNFCEAYRQEIVLNLRFLFVFAAHATLCRDALRRQQH